MVVGCDSGVCVRGGGETVGWVQVLVEVVQMVRWGGGCEGEKGQGNVSGIILF